MAERAAPPPPDLWWLPDPPSSWGADVAAEEDWDKLVALANHRLGGLQTTKLDRRLLKLFGDTPPPGLATQPVRLALLASSTIDHLLPALRVAALRRGLWLTTYVCDYGQYRHELLDTGSALHAFQPTALLFALDAHHLTGGFKIGEGAAAAADRVDALVDGLAGLWSAARTHFGGVVIQQAVLLLFPALLGNNEHRLGGSAAAGVAALNERLRARADAEGVDMLALDTQAARDGLRAWYDPVLWHRAKQEVHPLAAPVYGDLVARLLAARQGRASKCLVLDLDNTVWGGVIGDDGMDGIALGQGSALGEAFVGFQRYALDLSKRGIILALCSKNDEKNGLEPFDSHPEMLLRRSDIAAHAINWTDKVTNLRDIAHRLNIGLDSLVFADDNPFERTLVRRDLPMVGVPELPEDPALYAECIAAGGWFESAQPTEEDLERTKQYQANAQREAVRGSATDLEGYLRSLDMDMIWRRFDSLGQSRIVQLVNKTNQFNLTTRRTTDEEVAALIADDRALTLQIRLTDQFGDNGVIAIVAARAAEAGSGDYVIETWLMSCRVLGRQVEQATLNLVAEEAKRLGAKRLIGDYLPSAKNAMVRDHYAKLGFAPLSGEDGGETRWVLALDAFEPVPTFIRTLGG